MKKRITLRFISLLSLVLSLVQIGISQNPTYYISPPTQSSPTVVNWSSGNDYVIGLDKNTDFTLNITADVVGNINISGGRHIRVYGNGHKVSGIVRLQNGGGTSNASSTSGIGDVGNPGSLYIEGVYWPKYQYLFGSAGARQDCIAIYNNTDYGDGRKVNCVIIQRCGGFGIWGGDSPIGHGDFYQVQGLADPLVIDYTYIANCTVSTGYTGFQYYKYQPGGAGTLYDNPRMRMVNVNWKRYWYTDQNVGWCNVNPDGTPKGGSYFAVGLNNQPASQPGPGLHMAVLETYGERNMRNGVEKVMFNPNGKLANNLVYEFKTDSTVELYDYATDDKSEYMTGAIKIGAPAGGDFMPESAFNPSTWKNIGEAGGPSFYVSYEDGKLPEELGIPFPGITNEQSPYGGAARDIPGTIQAEDYDIGGESVSYHDTSSGNTGNQYRTDDVDIKVTGDSQGGGYDVGWNANGEWLEYTVDVTAGNYDINMRVGSAVSGTQVVVKLDGTTLGTINVPNLGNWTDKSTQTISNVTIAGGNNKVLRLEIVGDGVDINWIQFVTSVIPVTSVSVSPSSVNINTGSSQQVTATVLPSNATNKTVTWSSSDITKATVNSEGLITGVSAGNVLIIATTQDGGKTDTCEVTVVNPQSPYGGTARSIPGTVQAEDYDTGGESIAYHDTSSGNTGNQYRTDDVDIKVTGDSQGGGYDVGWNANGEWLEYTVDVTAGNYDINMRVGSAVSGTQIVVKLDGTTLGTINVPNLGNWTDKSTQTISNVTIAGGNNKVLRLEIVGDGVDINWIEFVGTCSDQQGTVTCYKAASTITVDGNLDENSWCISNTVTENIGGTTNNTVTFGVLYDNSNIYVGVKVLDSQFNAGVASPITANDAIEIEFDPENNGGTTYDTYDRRYVKAANASNLWTNAGGTTGASVQWVSISGGYTMEFKIPFSLLNLSAPPANNYVMGFDIINWDNDNGSSNTGKLVWEGTAANTYNPSAFGDLVISSTLKSAQISTGTLPIGQAPILEKMTMFPNPVKVGETLKIDGIEGIVSIFDMQGRLVYNNQATSGYLEIPVTMSKGTYVVTIRNGQQVARDKLIVK